jgi:uncharacterized protein
MSSQTTPRRALVTGASAGIGAAFARELAARGYALVLTARRTERLELLASELRQRHSVEVTVLPADLAQTDASARLLEELRTRGLDIDMLVNNAGYGVSGHFEASSWATHADFIQVLMTAPTELCYRLLPGMQARGYGRIINVASLAGHIPGSAGNTLYAASKSYLIKFSQSLALENRKGGINVTALCPGFTYSEFHDVTGARELVSKMPARMWMSAEEVVTQGLDAVERGDIVYVNGRLNRIIKTLFKLLPDSLALKMIESRSKDFRVQQQAP